MAFSFIGILAVFLELFRAALVPLGVLLVAFVGVAIYVLLRRRQFNTGPAVRLAGAVGVMVALLAFALTPGFSGASHAQVTSIIDYAALFGASLGAGIGFGVVIYPFVQLAFRRAPG
ncbi:hypothetical protein HC341_09280 [Aquisalimonas sp. 2447]|uniref:hypothetical protein n=1 Tax=Aquisalimonas sp. 2447 TaxID=2740807 RepID=UPI0014326DD4|nr:hypothetical protein [Aquisalimonas sp. 2447]QIT55380.1 hypothetical protein HC341_09280 [Aquisalimonas sp. 2447]